MTAPNETTEATTDTNLPLSAAAIAELKTKAGGVELRLFEVDDQFGHDFVVCKCPSRPEYKRLKQDYLDPGKRANALETLLRNHTVYPDAEGVKQMLDRRPGLAETFGEKLTDWAGAGAAVTEKKL